MKFNLFKTTKPPLIGVDISQSSIKMVELGSDGQDGYKLIGYTILPLAKDAMSEGNVKDLEKLSESIKAAHRALGSREKNVALALPYSAVITKKVIMEAGLSESEMESLVDVEASQFVTFPLDEVNVDFHVIGENPNNSEQVDVLIAAAKKEKIEDRVAAAEGANLKVVAMDAENYATEAAFSLVIQHLEKDTSGDKVVMILDIGAETTNINVMQSGFSVFNRDQTFGGNILTNEIARKYGMTSEEADQAKRKGTLPETYAADVLDPFLKMLAAEVSRSIQFFTSSTQFNHVDFLVLAGGCSGIPSITEVVESHTNIPTHVANPFLGMLLGSKLDPRQVTKDAPALMIACGLAMKGVDL